MDMLNFINVLTGLGKLSDDTLGILTRTLDVVVALRLLEKKIGWTEKEVLDLLTLLSIAAYNVESNDGTFNYDEIVSVMEFLDPKQSFKQILDSSEDKKTKELDLMAMLYTKMYYDLCTIDGLEDMLVSSVPEVIKELDYVVDIIQQQEPQEQSQDDVMHNRLAAIYRLAFVLEEAKS